MRIGGGRCAVFGGVLRGVVGMGGSGAGARGMDWNEWKEGGWGMDWKGWKRGAGGSVDTLGVA